MPTPMIEGNHTGEFVRSISNASRSSERVTLTMGQALKAGTVLGQVTATGKYKIVALGATDGTQVASAVLIDDVDATAADLPVAVMARDCELNAFMVAYPAGATTANKVTINAALAAQGIIVRP